LASLVSICNTALARIGIRDFILALTDGTMHGRACAQLAPMALDTVTEDFPWQFAEKRALLSQVAPPYAAWSSLTTYGLGQSVTVAGTPGYFTSLVVGNLNQVPSTTGTPSWQYFATYTRSGWNYMYAVPADYLSARAIQFQLDDGNDGPWVNNSPIPPPQWLRTQDPHAKTEYAIESSDDGQTAFILTNMVAAELIYTGSLQARGLLPPLFSDALAWFLARDLAMCLPNKMDYAKGADAKYEAALLKAGAKDMNQQQLHEPESEFILTR
jgi:hypothetical protein